MYDQSNSTAENSVCAKFSRMPHAIVAAIPCKHYFLPLDGLQYFFLIFVPKGKNGRYEEMSLVVIKCRFMEGQYPHVLNDQ